MHHPTAAAFLAALLTATALAAGISTGGREEDQAARDAVLQQVDTQWAELDLNNDGVLTIHELTHSSMADHGGDEASAEGEATSIHSELDWNQDGTVTKIEYEKFMLHTLGEHLNPELLQLRTEDGSIDPAQIDETNIESLFDEAGEDEL